MKNQSLQQKLKNAWNGILFTYKTENNFRFHCCIGIATVIVFGLLQINLVWWGLIFICIGLVIAAELANTAIETLLDHIHPQRHPAIGKVKDIMAGVVLSLSLLALIIACLAIIDRLY